MCRRSANGASSWRAERLRQSPSTLPSDLRFLTLATIREMFDFPRDMARVPVETNRLHTQALVRYYEREWATINR